jgi:hypothetical protein
MLSFPLKLVSGIFSFIYIKQVALKMHAGLPSYTVVVKKNKNWNTHTIFFINIFNMSKNPFSSVEVVTSVQPARL